MDLTASQEDYLEAILGLIGRMGTARVRDIAEQMGVAKSSVTVALRGLAKRKLVNYKPYELVTLTRDGRAMAERIRHRHKELSGFFLEVLDVDQETAEANACRIEHAVGDGVMRRLSCFVAFMGESSVPAKELPRAFREYCAQQRQGGDCEGCRVGAKPRSGDEGQGENNDISTTLAGLRPGEKAKIVRVGGPAAANRRLMEMGLTRGAAVAVVRVAPLGDPVEVLVRGYNLSLRKAEAKAVKVERIS
jgi:DtxR family Mn-dependent transcriptional regulator